MADLTITAANIALLDNGAKTRWVKVGEGVTQFQPLYLKAADGLYWRADNNVTVAEASAVVITLTKAAAGKFALVALAGALVDLGAILAVGEVYCVSANVGMICPYADVTSTRWRNMVGGAETTSAFRVNCVMLGQVA